MGRNVRKNVAKFDIVVAKLDARNERAYRIINRLTKGSPDIETIKESIKKLKEGKTHDSYDVFPHNFRIHRL